MTEAEEPLEGGRVTCGVVRIGETVRRPISTDRTLQHNLLRHLEIRRLEGAPRFLGIDRKGREILSFLPGQVPRDLGHFSDTQLAAAAGVLRRFHDATADFPLVQQRGEEVMCHNDWGPPNAVFQKGVPYGIIDFDTIMPGLRLWDLGYSAFSWLDIGNTVYSPDEQLRRLFIFSDAYGLPACSAKQIAVHAIARQTTLAAWARAQGKIEMADWAASIADWTALNMIDRLLPTGFPR